MGAEHPKTNAMRMLDAAGIAYESIEYEVDESDLSGESVARKVGVDSDRVFKTLVLRSDAGDHLVACVPVSTELDLKSLASASCRKSVAMIPVKDLLSLTGYVRGGCSPVGMKKSFPTYFDETVLLHDRIAVSAGIRGLQLLIAPEDLLRFVGGVSCDIAR